MTTDLKMKTISNRSETLLESLVWVPLEKIEENLLKISQSMVRKEEDVSIKEKVSLKKSDGSAKELKDKVTKKIESKTEMLRTISTNLININLYVCIAAIMRVVLYCNLKMITEVVIPALATFAEPPYSFFSDKLSVYAQQFSLYSPLGVELLYIVFSLYVAGMFGRDYYVRLFHMKQNSLFRVSWAVGVSFSIAALSKTLSVFYMSRIALMDRTSKFNQIFLFVYLVGSIMGVLVFCLLELMKIYKLKTSLYSNNKTRLAKVVEFIYAAILLVVISEMMLLAGLFVKFGIQKGFGPVTADISGSINKLIAKKLTMDLHQFNYRFIY